MREYVHDLKVMSIENEWFDKPPRKFGLSDVPELKHDFHKSSRTAFEHSTLLTNRYFRNEDARVSDLPTYGAVVGTLGTDGISDLTGMASAPQRCYRSRPRFVLLVVAGKAALACVHDPDGGVLLRYMQRSLGRRMR